MASESGLYRSSLVKDSDSELVPQSQLLDPSSFEEKTVPTFDETDYQSKWSVGVWLGGRFLGGLMKVGIVHGKISVCTRRARSILWIGVAKFNGGEVLLYQFRVQC